jgi:hypothetical protein
MEVYMVQHVHHAAFIDGRPTEHTDEQGQLQWDEEDGDNIKVLGVFTTPELAQARIERASRTRLPGRARLLHGHRLHTR